MRLVAKADDAHQVELYVFAICNFTDSLIALLIRSSNEAFESVAIVSNVGLYSASLTRGGQDGPREKPAWL